VNSIKKLLLGFGVILIFSSAAIASTEKMPNGESNHQWWLNLGVGFGGNGKFGGVADLIDANYRLSEYKLISARALQTNKFLGANNFTDVGVLYGLIAKGKYGYASASAGLSWVQYKEGYTYWVTQKKGPGYSVDSLRIQNVRTINTIGIPAEVQLFVTPTPYVGIGLIGFANANTASSISGVMLALQIGNLW